MARRRKRSKPNKKDQHPKYLLPNLEKAKKTKQPLEPPGRRTLKDIDYKGLGDWLNPVVIKDPEENWNIAIKHEDISQCPDPDGGEECGSTTTFASVRRGTKEDHQGKFCGDETAEYSRTTSFSNLYIAHCHPGRPRDSGPNTDMV